jgi:glycosyltransferase involved in cell wall biosynthesis
VIASAAGGALEIVEDGRTGLLVAPGDSVSLAAAVRTLLDDTARAAQLASAGRAAALSRFSLDASVSRIHAAIAATRRVPGRSIRG